MILATLALLQAAAGAAAPAGNDVVPWEASREATSLAVNIDKAIQACDEHIASRTAKAVPGQAALEAKGIKFQDEAPDAVKLATGVRFGPARFHQWLDPHADIWLAAYNEAPSCRIFVKGKYAAVALPELQKLIQVDNYYKVDTAQSSVGIDYVRTIFRGSSPASMKVNPTVMLTSPIKANDPKFMFDLAVLVAMVEKN